jgi:predicted cupin superfamily sugar epimerase
VTAEEIIQNLRLEKHPEGGWYRRTYQSKDKVRLERGERFASTSIYYLLSPHERSALHRLRSDETWYYHAGCGLKVHLFTESGYEKRSLGNRMSEGETPQLTIPAGTVFGAELLVENEWCLIGCSVCPGFDFADFELINGNEIMQRFPEQQDWISHLFR